MLIDVGHEEPVRARSEVPHHVDRAAHDDRTERGAAQHVGIGRLFLDDARCREFLRLLLGCLPLGRLGHLEALIPDPRSDDDEMGKDEAVAEEPEHLIHRNGGGEHHDRAEHPRDLRRAAVFCAILRRRLLGDKRPRCHNIRTDREADDDIAEQEHGIVRREADNRNADHID